MSPRSTTLTPQHVLFLDAWNGSATLTSAAEAAGVDRTTAGKWLANPEHPVSIEWARRCEVASRRAMDRLRSLTESAVDALGEVVRDREATASARVAAAREILGRAGIAETTRQELAVDAGRMAVVAKLEAVFAAGVDGDDVLEALDHPAIESDDD